jgi:catechol 2,3-dioxygenase-like lactoylglutathione lyase family enzyme
MMSAIRHVLIGVSDMERSLALYRDTVGLTVEADFAMSESLRSAWGLPAGVTARLVDLSCGAYPFGRIRLAAFEPQPSQRVRSDSGPDAIDTALDVGPKAIDFYVRDPIGRAIGLMEAAGYRPRSEPVKHRVGETVSEELLFTGPDGLPILLMVGHVHAANVMRQSWTSGEFSEVATISVVTGDLDASRRFYGDLLGMTAIDDLESDPAFRDNVSRLTGTPQGSRIHWMLFAQPGEPSGKILVVHFFERTGKRLTGRMRPGHLGFSLLSHTTPKVDVAAARAVAAGFDVFTPSCVAEIDGETRELVILKGPNEELLELVGDVG